MSSSSLKKEEQTDKANDFVNSLLSYVLENPDPEAIKAKARGLVQEQKKYSYTGRSIARAGHRAYDLLIKDMFDATQSAIPRELLLEKVLNQLDGMGKLSQAELFFTLEAVQVGGQFSHYEGGIQRRIHEKHWRSFCDTKLANMRSSLFLEQLFAGQQEIDIWHMPHIVDYDGEFDTLFSPTRHKKGSHRRDYWLSAIFLPSSDRYHSDRALFIIYPSIGSEFSPIPPPCASQEWRVIHFLITAYRQLEHQLSSLSEMVHAQRQELLNTLAPGVLHHEIGINMGLINQRLEEQYVITKALYDDYDHPLIEKLAHNVEQLINIGARLNGISDAFNNLEKRSGAELFKVNDLIQNLRRMMHHRLGNVGVALVCEPKELTQQLNSDRALLLHLLINIVNNAVNAFPEIADEVNTEKKKRVLLRVYEGDKDHIVIDLLNNGPSILPRNQERIFQRGFTTRASGHGQGLFISRLIAHYLGGSLELVADEQFQVCFRLTIPSAMPNYGDLESDRK